MKYAIHSELKRKLTGFRIEVLALSLRRQHAHLVELKGSHGSETDVDSSDNGLVTLASSQSKDGLLESQEG